jgi:hypothetical protein
MRLKTLVHRGPSWSILVHGLFLGRHCPDMANTSLKRLNGFFFCHHTPPCRPSCLLGRLRSEYVQNSVFNRFSQLHVWIGPQPSKQWTNRVELGAILLACVIAFESWVSHVCKCPRG